MAESAFGVDHGGIEKAFGGASSNVAAGLKKVGTMLGQHTQAASAALKPVQGPKAPGFAGGVQRATAVGQTKVGNAMNKVGGGMMKKPGLTGGIAAGGAAGGVAGAGYGAGKYSVNRNKKPGQ